VRRLPVRFPGTGAWNGVGVRLVVVGTLLGPEGAGRSIRRVGGVVISVPGPPGPRTASIVWRVWRGRFAGGDWSYVENCTVDASIFN
jgi:hypothetical protein